MQSKVCGISYRYINFYSFFEAIHMECKMIKNIKRTVKLLSILKNIVWYTCTLNRMIWFFWSPRKLVAIPVSKWREGILLVPTIVVFVVPRDVVLCVFIPMMVEDVFLSQPIISHQCLSSDYYIRPIRAIVSEVHSVCAVMFCIPFIELKMAEILLNKLSNNCVL